MGYAIGECRCTSVAGGLVGMFDGILGVIPCYYPNEQVSSLLNVPLFIVLQGNSNELAIQSTTPSPFFTTPSSHSSTASTTSIVEQHVKADHTYVLATANPSTHHLNLASRRSVGSLSMLALVSIAIFPFPSFSSHLASTSLYTPQADYYSP
jgi:hypothetical protein